MDDKNKIQLFENKKIRTAWDEVEETWYLSIVDVIAVLTESKEPRRYWREEVIQIFKLFQRPLNNMPKVTIKKYRFFLNMQK